MDKISLQRIQTLHPLIREDTLRTLEEAFKLGIIVRITQAFRTWAEQDDLYNLGRIDSVAKIVTNARGGQSWHNYGLAWDFCLLTPDGKSIIWNRNLDINGDNKPDWMQVVDCAKEAAFEWGGDWTKFKDYPHFQKTFGMSIDEAKSLYMAKSFDDEGYIII